MVTPAHPALPCSRLDEPQDGTPPLAASAADGHPQPPRLAWDEDAPAVAGRPDAGGQPPESHSHTGQGNQAGWQRWQLRTDATPSALATQARFGLAVGSGSDRPTSRWAWPELCARGDPASLSLCLGAQEGCLSRWWGLAGVGEATQIGRSSSWQCDNSEQPAEPGWSPEPQTCPRTPQDMLPD